MMQSAASTIDPPPISRGRPADTDQRPEPVEKAHEKQRQQDREKRKLQHAGDVEVQRDSRQRTASRRWRVAHP